jgi:LysR family glycine cleavage system transcriptional activator
MEGGRVPRLSLDLLRGFRAAARHLSFTRAAQELCVTQSAISREVKTLEEQLGTPLFHRVNRSLQLTQAGEALYRVVDEAIDSIDCATQRLVGHSHPLTVTLLVALASLWLGPRLPRFARAHPEIDIRVLATNDVLDLEREHIDVAIRYAPKGQPAPSADKLFDYRTFPACSPQLASDPTRPIRVPQDLARHVLLDFETTRNGRPWQEWRAWFEAMRLPALSPAGFLRFSHYDQVVRAAIDGSGVAIGKWPHLEQQLREGVLVAPLGDRGVVTLGSIYVIVAKTAPPSAVEVFVDWLHMEARSSDG